MLNIKDIIENLNSTNNQTVLKTLEKLLFLNKQKTNISETYNLLHNLFTSEDEEIRWKVAEIFNIIPKHLDLKNATSEEKLRELEFLADCTIPNI